MTFHSTVLFVKDITVAKEFYTQNLDFSVIHDFGNNIVLNNGLSLWQINSEHTIAKNLTNNSSSHNFELYFESDCIDAIYEKLQINGITLFHSLVEESWGQRNFRFFDPDNHLIEIGEPLEVFIFNMHKQGLSNSEISIKSGVPIETVASFIQHHNT